MYPNNANSLFAPQKIEVPTLLSSLHIALCMLLKVLKVEEPKSGGRKSFKINQPYRTVFCVAQGMSQKAQPVIHAR